MIMDAPRIAVIEDNTDLREELLFFLQAKGYPVWGTPNAELFWKQLHRNPVDIILVDIGLPGEDGFSVVDYLRDLADYGLIVLTARGSQQDKVRGLSLGADFYMIKPVNFANLMDAINSLWQRIRYKSNEPGHDPADEPPHHNGWTLGDHQLIPPNDQPLSLTPQEHNLLTILFQRFNEVCSKELLHNLLFGYEATPDTHRIDVIVSRLRSKARQRDINLPIRTVFGKGLVFLDRSA